MDSNESKRDKFIRLVEPRVDRALHAIHVISKMGGKNSSNYDYGPSDIASIASTLSEAVMGMADRMMHEPRQIPMPFKVTVSGEKIAGAGNGHAEAGDA